MTQENSGSCHPCGRRIAGGHATRLLSQAVLSIVFMSLLLTAVAEADSRGLTGAKGLSLSSPLSGSVKLLQKDVEARIKEIEGNEGLDKDLKKKLLTLYQQSLSYLIAADSFEQSAAAYVQNAKTIPGEIAEVRKKVEEAQASPATVPVEDVSKVPPTELDFRLTVAGAELDALRGDLDAMENMLQEQKGRPAQIREELKAAREALNEIDREMTALRVSQDPPMVVEARRVALIATRKARAQEIQMLNRELFSYGPRLQLFAAQRDLKSLALARAEMRLNALREAVAARQRAEAEKRNAESLAAGKAASGKHAAVVKLSEENARLVQELNSVVEKNADAIEARNKVRDELRRLERNYRETKQKIDVAGRSRALGHLLVEEYRSLPDVKQYEGEAKTTQRKIDTVSLRLLETEESTKSPAEVGIEVEEVMKQDFRETLAGHDKKTVEAEVRQLLTDRQAVMRKLADAYTSYLDTLSDLDNRQRETVETLHKYRTLLDEWILWVPSTTPLGKSAFRELFDLKAVYASRSNWNQVGRVIRADFVHAPQAVALFVLLFILLLWTRRWLRKKFTFIEQQVENSETDRFALTLSGLVVTVLLSLPLPLLFSVLGWRLEEAHETGTFAQALGRGFSVLVFPTLYLRTFYHFCSPNGVGVVHFKWRKRTAALLRRHLVWYTLIFLSLVFNITVAWQVEEAFRSRGGTLSFIALMCASTLFLQFVLRPRGGALEQYLKQNPDGWLARFRRIWYPAAVCIPLALAGLAATGYLYTAVILSRYVIRSFWLMLAALILHELAVRWLRLAGRRMTRTGGEDQAGSAATAAPGQTIPLFGLPDSGAQTLRMFHFLIGSGLVAMLLMVWSDILPALSILQQVKLWQHTVTVGGKEVPQPFTLWSLAVMVILFAVTVVLWRNLPGVIDLAVLQRARISAASRYAIRRMIRYSIVAFGIVAVFKSVGGEWSQIQWLIAALSVGLGFGLQEIVANFISGIIILFEQPIRVGDVVTIGDVSGKVARIDIRATTITDFDNKDLVVPNKNFITGQLINWTLTSPVTRLTINVGIAYGSDTALAHRVMLETVRANPLVLNNPEPRVFFTAFGESSLDFTIYVFVKELADRLPLTHELHMAIEKALRERGIEIPFPQRDVNIRSLPDSAEKPWAGGRDKEQEHHHREEKI